MGLFSYSLLHDFSSITVGPQLTGRYIHTRDIDVGKQQTKRGPHPPNSTSLCSNTEPVARCERDIGIAGLLLLFVASNLPLHASQSMGVDHVLVHRTP